MLGSYKTIAVILVIAISIVSGLGYLYTNSLEKVGKLEADLKANEQETQAIRQNMLEMVNSQEAVESQMRDISKQSRGYSAEIETFRGRESTVVARPGRIEIKINKAFILREEQWACATGAEEYCIEQD